MTETQEIKTTTGCRVKSTSSSATEEEDEAVVVRMEPLHTGVGGTNTDTPQSNGAITAGGPDPAAKPSLVGAMGDIGKVGTSGESLNGKECEPISVSSLDTDLSDYYADQSEAAESSSVVDEAGRHRRRRRRKESELQQQQGRAEKDGETDTQGEEDEDDDTRRKKIGCSITAITCTSDKPLSTNAPPLPLIPLQNLHLGNDTPSHSSPLPTYPSSATFSTPGGETPWEDGNTSTTTTATAADDSSDLESTDGQTPSTTPNFCGASKMTSSPNGVTFPGDSK